MTEARSNSKHPNRTPFEGVLARLDVPTDAPPNGSSGHRVILTTQAARAALSTLVGMGVGFRDTWDGHNRRQKCGVINEAWIDGDELWVSGYIFSRDFPEVYQKMSTPGVDLGMSYEMTESYYKFVDVPVGSGTERMMKLGQVIFTGAAILLRSKAACKTTTVDLEAASAAETNPGQLYFADSGRIALLVPASRRPLSWFDAFSRWLRTGR